MIKTIRNSPVAQWIRAQAAIILIATASLAQAQATPPAEPTLTYTIRPGDKFIKLGSQLLRDRTDWPEVARLNRITDPNALRPGQTLQVPVRLMKSTPQAGRVVAVSGDVQLGGTPATVGSALAEGAQLRTGTNSSAVIELADGSRMTLLPGTVAELATSRGYAMRAAGAKSATTWFSGLVRLAQGALDTVAAKAATRATPLQIQTPTSLVGVRGTQFRVAYDDPATQNARTEVLEGLVRADNPAQGSGAALEKGKGAVLNPAVREITVVDLLPPPALESIPSGIAKPRGLWPVPILPGAAAFRVQIASDEAFNRITRDLVVTTATVDLASLPDGPWFARVRGIDAGGIEGYDSVKRVEVRLAPTRRWSLNSDRLDVDGNSRHLLRVAPADLEAGDTVTALLAEETGSAAPTELVPVGRAVVGSGDIAFEMGTLRPGASYRLRLAVEQPSGAETVPLEFRFKALAGSGWLRNTLEPVAR